MKTVIVLCLIMMGCATIESPVEVINNVHDNDCSMQSVKVEINGKQDYEIDIICSDKRHGRRI